MSEEALQIAEKIREVKGKGERERYTQLNAEFQRIARRVKKAFLNEQCKVRDPANMGDSNTRPNLEVTAAAAKSLQSCPALCDSIDGSPPGSPVPGILQARTLEWVAISFSNA